jgi:hypothetical protein
MRRHSSAPRIAADAFGTVYDHLTRLITGGRVITGTKGVGKVRSATWTHEAQLLRASWHVTATETQWVWMRAFVHVCVQTTLLKHLSATIAVVFESQVVSVTDLLSLYSVIIFPFILSTRLSRRL